MIKSAAGRQIYKSGPKRRQMAVNKALSGNKLFCGRLIQAAILPAKAVKSGC